LVQKYHPGGLPAFQGSARTTPLSDRELLTLKMRAEASTPPSIAELAAELGRCPTTIKKGLKRALEPLTPLGAAEKRRRRGGRKRLLTPEQNAFLRATIKKDPIGGPAEAAKALFRVHGVRASRWTIARELHRLYQPGDKPVRKRGTERYAPLTDQLLNMQVAHARAMTAYFELCGQHGVFWQDETPWPQRGVQVSHRRALPAGHQGGCQRGTGRLSGPAAERRASEPD
jgi:transposase